MTLTQPDGTATSSIISGLERPDQPRRPDARPVRSRLRPIAIGVGATGLAITAVLTWAAVRADNRSNAGLLELQAQQTAATLSAALPGIQSQLADALTVANDTDSPATFQKFVTNNINKSTLVSESLWQRSATGADLLATTGSEPLLVRDGRAASFFAAITSSPKLQVTRILPGDPPRLGYAEYPPSGSRYIVYAESPLPADKHLVIPKSSPYHQLDFALYLGPKPNPADLIEASAPTPITGTHTTVRVPFGDTAITLVAAPKEALAPAGSALVWIAALGGALLSLLSAGVVNYLSRRRSETEDLNAELGALYAEQRSIAETLQHALLPEALPSVAGMDIAARYWPGAHGVDIGGDWYDIVPIDSNRFFFVIGDVSGRGVRAAAVMASLRFAARGFALEGHPPSGVLDHLAKTLDFRADGHFATVLCGLVDVDRREVTLANAGHLPPVVVDNGTATTLPAPPMPPIGVTTGPFPAEDPMALPAGALMLLYTDGLVEKRGESLDEGIDRLRESAAQDAGGVQELLGKVIADLTMNAPDDDVAILALKWLS